MAFSTPSPQFLLHFLRHHIYSNHFDQGNEQLQRTPRRLPHMVLNPDVKSIFDFRYDDFKLEDYDPYPPIKGVVAV